VLDSARNVATNVISVILLESAWRHNVASQYAIAKAGGKALDLGFDAGRHVVRRSMRHMAVGPGGVLAGRGTRWIKQALLGDDHIRHFGRCSCARGLLRGGDFGQGASQVYRGGAETRRGPP